MLVLACGIRTDTDKAFQLHDVDQLAIARPVTKAQLRAERGAEIYAMIRRACRIARTPPAGPVVVEIPVNHYLFRHDVEIPSTVEPPPPRTEPQAAEVAEVRALLAGSRRPLLYLGLGADGAGANLVTLAERLEAPVATTFQGKGVFPESHPLWLWCGFGEAAPPFVRDVAASCDLTLAIGCRFSEVGTGSYGLKPPGLLVHVDVDASVIGKNYPAEMGVVADAAAFVEALLENLPERRAHIGLRDTIRAGHREVWAEWARQAGERVSPPYLLKSLQGALGPDALYTTDSGNGTFLAMECLRLDQPRSFLAPVDYSCMGYAVPAALGAALACPERPVAALAGDGAFLMTGLELLTASQLALPVMVLVLRDRELAQISQFQQTALGRKSCSELPDYDLAALARGMGVEYLAMERNAEVEPVLRAARAITSAGRPVLVEVEIDYSQKTYFTRGVVKTNFARLPWGDRLRFVARALGRKLR
jgi:acetolactate synthase-1/2/3 large subunit